MKIFFYFLILVVVAEVVVGEEVDGQDEAGRVLLHEIGFDRGAFARSLKQFSCRNRPPGYYADVASNCRLYHACRLNKNQFVSRTTYICPGEERFHLKRRTCLHKSEVRCEPGFAPIGQPSSTAPPSSAAPPKDFFFTEDIWDAEEEELRSKQSNLDIWYIPEKRQLKCYTCCRPRKHNENNQLNDNTNDNHYNDINEDNHNGISNGWPHRPTTSTSPPTTTRPWTTKTTRRPVRPTWIVHVPRPTTTDSQNLDANEIEIIDVDLKQSKI